MMEAVGLCLIGGVAYVLNSRDGGIQCFAIARCFGACAQRILPALQQTYSAWATIKATKVLLKRW